MKGQIRSQNLNLKRGTRATKLGHPNQRKYEPSEATGWISAPRQSRGVRASRTPMARGRGRRGSKSPGSGPAESEAEPGGAGVERRGVLSSAAWDGFGEGRDRWGRRGEKGLSQCVAPLFFLAFFLPAQAEANSTRRAETRTHEGVTCVCWTRARRDEAG